MAVSSHQLGYQQPLLRYVLPILEQPWKTKRLLLKMEMRKLWTRSLCSRSPPTILLRSRRCSNGPAKKWYGVQSKSKKQAADASAVPSIGVGGRRKPTGGPRSTRLLNNVSVGSAMVMLLMEATRPNKAAVQAAHRREPEAEGVVRSSLRLILSRIATQVVFSRRSTPSIS